MARLLPALLLSALCATASGDTLVLKDGTVIEWKVLRDNSDTVEVQTNDNRTITVHKKDIKEVRFSVPRAPLAGATFTGDQTRAAAAPVNVLALLNAKAHAKSGEWRISGGALTGSSSGGAAVLETPHAPAPAYDVELVVERKDGTGEFHLGLVSGERPFHLVLDWGKGECSGLSTVDGRRLYENDSRANGQVLAPRKPRAITVAVREDRVVLVVDGKEHMHWRGDPKRLGSETMPADLRRIFLVVQDSAFSVSKLVVTPRKPGDGAAPAK